MEQIKNNKSLKMGNSPIGKLLFAMSMPAIFSMLIQALYNVVDSYYISQYSTTDNEIKALSFAFPMQILMMGFALGVGVGANSLISRKLGAHKYDDASNVARTGIVLSIISSIIFVVVGLTLVKPYLNLVSNIPEVQESGFLYLRIALCFSFGMFIEVTCNKILQSMGRMLIPMLTQLIGAITNIILDPILIYGRYGMPELGIRGAAIATVIGQIFAMIFVISYMFYQRKKLEVDMSFKNYKLRGQDVTGILKVGAPTAVMNSISSLTVLSLNTLLNTLDPEENATAALGLYFKLQSFVFMPVFGLNQGGMPILGYNFGANNKKRFLHAFKLLLIWAFIIMVLGAVIFQLFANDIVKLFSNSEVLLRLGSHALRVISLSFIPASISVIVTMMFQAIGHGMKSLFMSLLRQVIILLPFSLLLSKIIGLDGVWYAYPISETLCILIFIPIAILVIKKEFEQKEITIS